MATYFTEHYFNNEALGVNTIQVHINTDSQEQTKKSNLNPTKNVICLL